MKTQKRKNKMATEGGSLLGLQTFSENSIKNGVSTGPKKKGKVAKTKKKGKLYKSVSRSKEYLLYNKLIGRTLPDAFFHSHVIVPNKKHRVHLWLHFAVMCENGLRKMENPIIQPSSTLMTVKAAWWHLQKRINALLLKDINICSRPCPWTKTDDDIDILEGHFHRLHVSVSLPCESIDSLVAKYVQIHLERMNLLMRRASAAVPKTEEKSPEWWQGIEACLRESAMSMAKVTASKNPEDMIKNVAEAVAEQMKQIMMKKSPLVEKTGKAKIQHSTIHTEGRENVAQLSDFSSTEVTIMTQLLHFHEECNDISALYNVKKSKRFAPIPFNNSKLRRLSQSVEFNPRQEQLLKKVTVTVRTEQVRVMEKLNSMLMSAMESSQTPVAVDSSLQELEASLQELQRTVENDIQKLMKRVAVAKPAPSQSSKGSRSSRASKAPGTLSNLQHPKQFHRDVQQVNVPGSSTDATIAGCMSEFLEYVPMPVPPPAVSAMPPIQSQQTFSSVQLQPLHFKMKAKKNRSSP